MENDNVLSRCENFIFVLKYCVVYRRVTKSEIMQKFSMKSTEVDEVIDWMIKNNYIEVDGESLSSKITFPSFVNITATYVCRWILLKLTATIYLR